MSESMRVTIFGSAAGFPTKRRPNTTSIGVWRGADLYLLDAGEGVTREFARRGVSPEALRAIFISHMHADHTGGLPTLIQWLQLNERKRPLTLCLPGEAVEGFRALLSLHYLPPEWFGVRAEAGGGAGGIGVRGGGADGGGDSDAPP